MTLSEIIRNIRLAVCQYVDVTDIIYPESHINIHPILVVKCIKTYVRRIKESLIHRVIFLNAVIVGKIPMTSIFSF